MSRTFTPGRSRSRRLSRRARQPWRWVPFAVRLRVARLRNFVLQRRIVPFVLRAGLVVVVVGLLVGASARSRTVQERWGSTAAVVVLGQDAAVGAPTGDLDWRIEQRPVAFVPTDALAELPVRDDVLVRSLRAGDVATMRDLRSTSPALDPGSGRRAVSVPLDPSVPPLSVGDEVDVFLVDDAFGQRTSDGALRLQTAAVVLDVTSEAVTLSVAASDVQALANTALHGSVVMALR